MAVQSHKAAVKYLVCACLANLFIEFDGFCLDTYQEENDVEYEEEGEAVDDFDSDFDEDVSLKCSISHH